jgi:heme-degrading monooxygenase HmoA
MPSPQNGQDSTTKTSSAVDSHDDGALISPDEIPPMSTRNKLQTTEFSSREEDAIADTPSPPYYAVIFTSIRSDNTDHTDDYAQTAKRMVALAKQQPGYLGSESVREEESSVGITVSYWKDLASIRNWKQQAEHLEAQEKGKQQFYHAYKTRIALVERDYELMLPPSPS